MNILVLWYFATTQNSVCFSHVLVEHINEVWILPCPPPTRRPPRHLLARWRTSYSAAAAAAAEPRPSSGLEGSCWSRTNAPSTFWFSHWLGSFKLMFPVRCGGSADKTQHKGRSNRSRAASNHQCEYWRWWEVLCAIVSAHQSELPHCFPPLN